MSEKEYDVSRECSDSAVTKRPFETGDPESTPVLDVHDLQVYFPIRRGLFRNIVGHVKAVDGISFSLHRGETFGLVGESGCGKTSAGKALVRLHPVHSGSIRLHGQELTTMSGPQLRQHRTTMQMIFQDPYSSLNPRMTVGEIIGEPIRFHRPHTDVTAETLKYMDMTGLRRQYINRYPHEFSGGQRQRIGIARALACQPEVLIADEPVSALDVSVQAQIVNLMQALQQEMGLAYLFIAHDLSVVKHISHRVGVMYLGTLVEVGESGSLYAEPLHPYTKALIASVPVPDPARRNQGIPLRGEIPSPLNSPAGCKFETRCPHATAVCQSVRPLLENVTADRQVACHHWQKIRCL